MEKSIAKVKIFKDRIEDFIAAVSEVSVPTRAEDGCVFYELYQTEDDPSVFYFCEEWKDFEDLQKHLASDHVAAFIKALDGVVEVEVEPVRWHKVV